ncbi:MAG: DegT/DnrJ/EryC1/StrS family aminotransferase [Pyrinomonadaceae bacterium]|nr:DegT/DnrJ/EryC1/StrS family aminotransferase [Pyrinomonadaceae bacterium]
MLIPFLDLTRQHREVEAELTAALARVMQSGLYTLGPEVEAFEKEWADFCGVRGAAAVGSGTDALALALIASGAVRKGCRDEVITSPLTAAYTALAITGAGGVPVFADIDPRTLTLDPQSVEEAINPRTRAIVPVHLYGRRADMTSLCGVAERYNLAVIEDAAQAHGAAPCGKLPGACGLAAVFSFYPTKNLGACGDGGAIVSNDLALIERIKTLRQGGHATALQGKTEGRNSRLDEVQAALLRVKLRYLDKWNLKRQSLAALYNEALLKQTALQTPLADEPGSHVYHLYVVQHPKREGLRAHLAARGIESMIHYPYLLHQQPLFQRNEQRRLPTAERVVKNILSLPLYPQMRVEEAVAVAKAVRDFEALKPQD